MQLYIVLVLIIAVGAEHWRWRELPFGFETTDGGTVDDDAIRK